MGTGADWWGLVGTVCGLCGDWWGLVGTPLWGPENEEEYMIYYTF